MSKQVIAIVVVAAAAAGAGAFGWQQNRERVQAQKELAGARSQLAKATGDLSAASEQAAALRKDLDELKQQTDQLRADRDSAKVLLEAEKARGERLVADLKLMREQIAFKTRQAPQLSAPMAVEPPRMVIRALPPPRPQSATTQGSPSPTQSSPGFAGSR